MNFFVNNHDNGGRALGRTLIRTLLTLAFVLAAVIAVGSIAIRFLIERSVRLDQVQSAASSAMGRDVRAAKIEVSALYGLVLGNVTIREQSVHPGDSGALVLNARTVRLRPSWWSLLGGTFRIASIKIIESDVYAVENRDSAGRRSWNLERLAADLAARSDTSAIAPDIIGEKIRVWIASSQNPYNGSNILFDRISASVAVHKPGDPVHPDNPVRVEFAISSFGDEKCRITGKWFGGKLDDPAHADNPAHADDLVRSRAEVEFTNLPSGLLAPLAKDFRYKNLNGAFQVAYGSSIKVTGSLDGKLLSLTTLRDGTAKIENFTARTITATIPLDDKEWELHVDNLKIGSAHTVKVSADVTGPGWNTPSASATAGFRDQWPHGRIEWEGAIEEILAIPPASIADPILLYRPRGPSAGHILFGPPRRAGSSTSSGRVGGTPPLLAISEISINARGISVRIPQGFRIPGAPDHPMDEAVIEDIHGRIGSVGWTGQARLGSSGSTLTMDTLAMTWDGDPLSISGRVIGSNGRDSSARYDISLSTPGFDVGKFSGFLPAEISLKGKLAAALHLDPDMISGNISFLGNEFAHASGARLRLTGGTMSISGRTGRTGSSGDRHSLGLGLHGVTAVAGSGRMLFDGEVRLEPDYPGHADHGTGSDHPHEPDHPAGSLNVRLTLENADIASLKDASGSALEMSGIKLTGGVIDGSVQANGSIKAPTLAGDVTFRSAAAEILGQSLSDINGPVEFDSTGAGSSGLFRTAGLSARAGDGRLKITGSYLPHEIKLSLVMNDINSILLQPMLAVSYPGLSVSGPIDADLAVASNKSSSSSGEPIHVDGTITFKGGQISAPTAMLGEAGGLARDSERISIKDLAGTLEIKPDRIIARNFSGNYQGGEAKLNGTIPRSDTGSYSLTVGLDHLRLEHFAALAPEGFVGHGAAEALSLLVTGKKSDPVFAGTIRLAGASLKMPFLAAPLSDVRGEASFAPGTGSATGSDSFATRGIVFKAGGSVIHVSGGIERPAPSRSEIARSAVFRNVALKTEGAHIEDLMKLLPESERPLPKGAVVTGLISTGAGDSAEIKIDGPLDNARWNGTITLKNGGGELPGLSRGITGVSGEIHFAGGKVSAEGLSGKIGSSDVRVEGEMELAAPYAMKMKLAIKDADIGELFAAIPKPGTWEGFDIKGHGTMTVSLHYANSRLKLDGRLVDGDAEVVKTAAGATPVPFTDVTGAFKYDGGDGVFAMSDMTSSWAGGKTSKGFFKVSLDQTPATFEASGTITGARLEEMVRLAGLTNGGYAGQVDGTLSVSGRFGVKDSINGAGSLLIQKAKFETLAPLNAISRTLRMDFFSKGTYETARGTFVIEKGVIRTVEPDHFRLMGSNFTLEARGYTTLDGECVYNYACGIKAGAVGNILTTLQLSRLFSMDGDNGVLRTSGMIRGRIDNPIVKTDLGILNVFR